MNELRQVIATLAQRVANLQLLLPRVWMSTVRSVSPLTVDGADGTLTLKCLGWYEPSLNDSAAVLQFGTTAFVLGAFTPNRWRDAPGPVGTVTAVSGSSASVTVSGVTYVMPVPDGYSPTVGHTVAVCWTKVAGGWAGVIIGRIQGSVPTTSNPATSNPGRAESDTTPPPSRPGGSFASQIVLAATAATWRGGWRTDRKAAIYQGRIEGHAANHGYWWHPGFAGYRGATCSRAEVWLKAVVAGAFGKTPVRLVLHSSHAKDAAEPIMIATIPVPWLMADGDSGWYPIPVEWGQMLIDGVAGGIGVASDAHSDYAAYAGLTQAVNSGAIRVWGTRTA